MPEARTLFRRLTWLSAIVLGALVTFVACGGGDDQQSPSVTASPSASPTAEPATATPVVPPLDDPYRMIIEKLGVDAAVEEYGLDADLVPEVPTGPGQAPGQIVAWYNFSDKPGVGSNAVFAGHVTWNGPAVFYSLDTLAVGDTIVLKDDVGTTLTYKVSRVYAVEPTETEVMAATPTDRLTIITCEGAYTANGDPVFGGSYDQRLVVQADLVGVLRAPAAG